MADYGTTTGVGALTPRYVDESGDFSNTTRPTVTQVETFLNEVCSILNIVLASEGFAVPITDTDVTPALDLFVNREVQMMCDGVNGSGRFGPREKTGTTPSATSVILGDVKKFVEEMAVGIERMGATRSYSVIANVGFRDGDASGNSIPPLWQREDYGFEANKADGEE